MSAETITPEHAAVVAAMKRLYGLRPTDAIPIDEGSYAGVVGTAAQFAMWWNSEHAASLRHVSPLVHEMFQRTVGAVLSAVDMDSCRHLPGVCGPIVVVPGRLEEADETYNGEPLPNCVPCAVRNLRYSVGARHCDICGEPIAIHRYSVFVLPFVVAGFCCDDCVSGVPSDLKEVE